MSRGVLPGVGRAAGRKDAVTFDDFIAGADLKAVRAALPDARLDPSVYLTGYYSARVAGVKSGGSYYLPLPGEDFLSYVQGAAFGAAVREGYVEQPAWDPSPRVGKGRPVPGQLLG